MSEETKIQWATHTFNPWEGCTKVSPGCAHCYAETRNHRFGMDNWGKGKPRRRTSAATWKNPVKWNRSEQELLDDPDTQHFLKTGVLSHIERPRVFPSLCDPFDDEVPIEWLADFLRLIHDTPNLDWLLLTKRPENVADRVTAALKLIDVGESMWTLGGLVPHNVWMGVSVEDQERADERIPQLLKIPAKVRFLSVEPLLGPVDLTRLCADESLGVTANALTGVASWNDAPIPKVNWVIVGGESGLKARPCNVDWIRSIVQQCAGNVPCFVKQLGAFVVQQDANRSPNQLWPAFTRFVINGACSPGTTLIDLHHSKGGEPSEWPTDLRIREFPNK